MTPTMTEIGRRARAASRLLGRVTTAAKDAGLSAAAELLEQRTPEILEANAADVAAAEAAGISATLIDRLRLDEARVAAMAAGIRDVVALRDPVGEVTEGWVLPNGIEVRRVRTPLGVIAIIYESRPNVTSDAAALCVKSSNAVILRGSSTALRSNTVIAEAVREGLTKADLPADAVQLVTDTRHETALELLRLREFVDCLIPRGGPGLIRTILENATVPYVIDGDGNCHVYVHADADLAMALRIVVNAKTQRPSVCNAAEKLLVHRDVADTFLPRVADALEGVELVGDERARAIVARIGPATDADWDTEYLDLKMAVAVVDDLDAAIAHINAHGSGHSEAIVTSSVRAADRFVREVDAAAVLVNASTRFVDGGQLGLGAEIGISTQKLHARGPMALRELTSTRFVIVGDGHVRT